MYGSRRVPVWRTAGRIAGASTVCLIALSIWLMPTSAQQPGRGRVTIKPASAGELRDWAPRIDSLRRSGDLRLRIRRDDPLVAGRTHERYDQFHRGVRVFGADVAEQLSGGQVVSAFGNVYEGIDVDTSPAIDANRARQIIEARAGVEIGRTPELVILPQGPRGRQLHAHLAGAGRRPGRRPRVLRRRTRRHHRIRVQRSPDADAKRCRAWTGRARRHQEDQRDAERRTVRGDRPAASAGDQHLRHAWRLHTAPSST